MKFRNLTNGQILGICGLTAAILGTAVVPLVGMFSPRWGFIVGSIPSGLMLIANLVLIIRKENR